MGSPSSPTPLSGQMMDLQAQDEEPVPQQPLPRGGFMDFPSSDHSSQENIPFTQGPPKFPTVLAYDSDDPENSQGDQLHVPKAGTVSVYVLDSQENPTQGQLVRPTLPPLPAAPSLFQTNSPHHYEHIELEDPISQFTLQPAASYDSDDPDNIVSDHEGDVNVANIHLLPAGSEEGNQQRDAPQLGETSAINVHPGKRTHSVASLSPEAIRPKGHRRQKKLPKGKGRAA